MSEQIMLITHGNGYDEYPEGLLIGEISSITKEEILRKEREVISKRETWKKNNVNDPVGDEDIALYRDYVDTRAEFNKHLNTLGCKRIELKDLERIRLH